MKTILKILGVLVVLVIVAMTGGYLYMANAYPDAGPVQEIEIEHNNEAMLARGKYLATHIAGCVECHSPRYFEYFSIPHDESRIGAGGMPFTREFGLPGVFHPRNITPAGIGDWPDAQLYHTLTTGVTPEGEPLFPLMPYKALGASDPEDVKAIIAYVRSLPPVEMDNNESEADFPMSLIMRTIPSPATPGQRPHPSNTIEYGKYLVRLGNCNECHTQMDQGQPVPGMEFAGGTEYDLSSVGVNGIVRSANLTPDMETGIGSWTRETFISMFKAYDNPEAHRIPWEKKGYQTVMPWTAMAGMTEEDLGAIYDYLRTLKPVKNKVEKWTPLEATVMN